MLRCLTDPIGCAVAAIPGWAWVLLTLCALLFVIGVALNLSRIASAIAGWWGVASVVGAVVTLFLVIWPKRRALTDPIEQLREDDRDALPAPAPLRPKKKPTKSILGGSLKDLLKSRTGQ